MNRMGTSDRSRLPAPAWLLKQIREAKRRHPSGAGQATRNTILSHRLHTVCDSAQCPNQRHCFSLGTATFMILGTNCTRNCRFCAVGHGIPEEPDPLEPERIAESVREMDLKHVVITSVTRDDLRDGGAHQFAKVIHSVSKLAPPVSTEVLLPDFQGSLSALRVVLDAGPNIVAHNIETIPRLYHSVRPAADYHRSLRLLSYAAKEAGGGVFVKSGFMAGLGEKDTEIISLMEDLREAGVQFLTIGQYLAPSLRHHAVGRFVLPEQFQYLEDAARGMGFIHTVAGPLVRSSYHAVLAYAETVNALSVAVH